MPSNTKQRILERALAMFNSHGLLPTTTRDVAAAVGISHGNLCYHYPSREAMAEALVHRWVLAAEEDRLSFVDLGVVQQHTVRTCQRLQQFRFVSLEWANLPKIVPHLSAHLQQYHTQRLAEWSQVMSYLERSDLLRDGLEPMDREVLPGRLLFTELCWPAFHPEAGAEAHANAVLGVLHLALGKKARKQWERVFLFQ